MPRGDARPDLLLATALRLFSERSIAGTSLQQIADDLGVSKAAVYHHFHSKSEIVRAVLRPALESIAEVVATARDIPDVASRRSWMIRALADQAIEHRTLYAIVLRDVAVADLLEDGGESFTALGMLLTGPDAEASRRVRTAIFLSGLIAPAADSDLGTLSDDELRAAIVDAGDLLLD